MTINYIDVKKPQTDQTNLVGSLINALNPIEYNREEDIEFFEKHLSKDSLELLAGMNVALVHGDIGIKHGAAYFTQTSAFTPYIGIVMDEFRRLNKSKLVSIINRKVVLRLLQHEMVHFVQWKRGDIDFAPNGTNIWKGRIYKAEFDIESSIDFYESQLSLPYEVEPYLLNFSTINVVDKFLFNLNPRMRKILKKAHADYVSMFGESFKAEKYLEAIAK